MCSKRRPLVVLCLCLGFAASLSAPAVAWALPPDEEDASADILAALTGVPVSGGSRLSSSRDRGGASVSALTVSQKLRTGSRTAGPSSRPAEVIVQFADGADTGPAGKAAGRAAPGSRREAARSLGSGLLSFAVYSSDSLGVGELAKAFEGVSGVVAVAPDSIRYLAGASDDPAFGEPVGLANTGQLGGMVDADIDASAAWDISRGSPDVVVAVIDTGVDYANPDLAANMWRNPGEIAGDGIDNDGNNYVDDVYGIDTKSNDSDPKDTYGHGTEVAGAVAAVGNNGLGTTGVAWTTKIMALRAGDEYGLNTFDVNECIQYAIAMKLYHGVNVVAINASFGGPGYNRSRGPHSSRGRRGHSLLCRGG